MHSTYPEQIKAGSPCRGICTTTFDAICQGCGRTVDEVANWVILDENEKQVIWARVLHWNNKLTS